MSRRGTFGTVFIVTIWALAAATAWGQGEVRSTSVSARQGYWTPERLRSARPYPLPLLRDPADDFQAGADAQPRDYGTSGLDFSSSRVVPADARLSYPYSAVGKLFFNAGGESFVCSAATVSARLVLTAAHCIYDEVVGEFSTDLMFAPGYHMGDSPFGDWTVNRVFISQVWADGAGVPNPEDWASRIRTSRANTRLSNIYRD